MNQSTERLLYIAAIIVLLCIITCNKSSSKYDDAISTVVPTKQLKQTVAADSTWAKVIIDSLTAADKKKAGRIIQLDAQLKTSQDKVTLMVSDVDNLLQNLPDNPQTQELKSRLRDLATSNNIKDATCNKTISERDSLLASKEKHIKTLDELVARKQRSLDTCLHNQDVLTPLAKPRTQAYAGITAIGSKSDYLSGFGINLGVKFKQGFMIEGGLLNIHSQAYGTVSIKKTISLRKRHG